MSQHDYVIDNAPGASVRSDLNNALQAQASTNKGNNRPATPYAGQLWLDDNTPSGTTWSLLMFDGSDDIKLGEFDTTANNWMPFVNGSSLSSFLASYTFPGTEATLPSSATTNLGSTGVFTVSITGTTTVTSLGSAASASAPLYFTRFTGALQLTHNATSLILLGGGNITTAAGATATWLYLGSGNWRMLSYEPALTAGSFIGIGSTGGKAALTPSGDFSFSGTNVSLNTGTGANQIVKLDGSAKLPAVDGSQLTGISGTPSAVTGTLSGNSNTVLTVDFTTYATYEIILSDAASSGGGTITVDVSSNGGSSYATAYRFSPTFTGAEIITTSNQAAHLVGVMTQAGTSGETLFTRTGAVVNTSGTGSSEVGLSRYLTSAAVNRIRFTCSGTLSVSGNIRLQPLSRR